MACDLKLPKWWLNWLYTPPQLERLARDDPEELRRFQESDHDDAWEPPSEERPRSAAGDDDLIGELALVEREVSEVLKRLSRLRREAVRRVMLVEPIEDASEQRHRVRRSVDAGVDRGTRRRGEPRAPRATCTPR